MKIDAFGDHATYSFDNAKDCPHISKVGVTFDQTDLGKSGLFDDKSKKFGLGFKYLYETLNHEARYLAQNDDPYMATAFILSEFYSKAGDPWSVSSVSGPYGVRVSSHAEALAKRFSVLLIREGYEDACDGFLEVIEGLTRTQLGYLVVCYALVEAIYFSGEGFDAEWVLMHAMKVGAIPSLREYFDYRVTSGEDIFASVRNLKSLVLWYGIDAIPGVSEWLDENQHETVPHLGVSWLKLLRETKADPSKLIPLLDQISKLPPDVAAKLF